MRKKRLFKQITALALSAMIFMGEIPLTSFSEAYAEEVHKIYTYDKNTGLSGEGAPVDSVYVSDSNTINGWKNFFTAGSTEYAGAVWTDKAVFTNGSSTAVPSDFAGMNKASVKTDAQGKVELDSNGNIVMETQANAYTVEVADENFLVAMSALGSTKQITGYSALPSDTVFILDLSNSMSDTDLDKMVEATNKAIAQLLAVNNYNRVGIVVYDTNSEVLLEIDRYTTTETATDDAGASYPVYIELANNRNQIVTARSTTTTTTTVEVTMPTDAQWDTIVAGIPEKGRWQDNDDYRRDVAAYLETALSTSVIGIDINWNQRLNRQNNLGGWSDQYWEQWLKQVLQNAGNNQTTVTSTTINLKGSDNAEVSASVSVGGATYIQGGINAALGLFKQVYDAGDTAIDTGLIQGGTARIPITVLMSDGAPTYATVDYTESDNSASKIGYGGNDSISDALVFPTQLSAAYLSQKMEEYYGRDGLFYTLGLGIEYAEANRVLNPYYNTSTAIDTYWTNYGNTAKDSIVSGYSYSQQNNGYGSTTHTITRKENVDDTLTNYRYYVDEYFPADDYSDLVNAFNRIVEAIIIQSKYYPTLVDGNAHDFDGYLTFEDEIGEFMEVKKVEGIVLGDTIYTGDAFLKALNDSDAFGNASTWTAYGEELLKSISERIGIQENEARTLLAAAYRAGGTNADGAPVNETGQLWTDNYIGWYADAQGNYLAHWDDEIHTEANYPEGAAYLNKSYIFQGDLTAGETSIAGGDMMHIVVQVHEEIATGNQCVIWKIPANLIPLITYEISVDSNSLDTAGNISLTMKEEEPIRLLYEVGLSDEINDVNMMEVVGASDHSHPVKDAAGNTVGYAFYSNRWGAGHILDGSGTTDVLDPDAHLATVSHFHPSEQNERYYYTEDSIIYSDQNGTVYKGDTAPTGDGYYHVYRIIEKDEETGKYQVRKKFVPVAADVLADTGDMAILRIQDETSENNGAWYIPAGQIYQQIARHQQKKENENTTAAGKDGVKPEAKGNVTKTINYYDYPVVVHGEGTDYSIYDFLGNNGRLVKYSTAGIKLTKTIDDSTAAGTVEFTFQIALSNASGLKLCDADGNDITAAAQASGKLAVDANTATVKIKNGETVYIVGLAAGTTYTVSEVISRVVGQRLDDYTIDDNYAVKEVKYNTVAAEVTVNTATETTADGTVVTTTSTTPVYTIRNYEIDGVDFVNTKSTHEGNLEVEKIVTHPYGADYVLASDLVFPVVVELGSENAGKTFEATGTVNNGTAVSSTLSADAEGKIPLSLGHEDSVVIKGIAEGTDYTVTENLEGKTQWKIDEVDSMGLTGTIISDSTVFAKLVNDLETIVPADTKPFTLEITKEISGGTWGDGWTFDFIVERYNANASAWENILAEGEYFETTAQNPTISVIGSVVSGSDVVPRITFDTVGTYYYRITEYVPDNKIAGITYDTTHRYFYFVVTDTNTDGVLEIQAREYSGTTVTKNGDHTTIAATFINYYASAVAEISLSKSLANDTGVDVPLNSFTFEFCDTNHAVSGSDAVVSGGDAAHRTLTPNVDGNLTFLEVYTEADLDDVEWNYTPASGGDAANAIKVKTFTYYLWEKNNGADGTTYDGSVYQIDVVVTVTKGDPSNSIAVTSKTVTRIADAGGNAVNETGYDVAQFSNTFDLDPVLPVSINVKKTLEGRNIRANEFTFELYKTGASFSITGVTPSTVKVGDGSSATAATSFELFNSTTGMTAGTYYYVIKEASGDNAAITYDPTIYYVTVVIGQGDSDGDGKNDDLLVTSITVNKLGGDIKQYTAEEIKNVVLAFTNTYSVVKNVQVEISGDKDLTGKNLLADEFTFGLYSDAACTEQVLDASGKHMTANNLATSGAFTFAALEFGAAGEYTYYVKEMIPAVPVEHGILTYDKSVYEVVIKVTDLDGNGVLEAKTIITKIADNIGGSANESAETIKFTNTYEPDPVTAKVVKGEKQYVDENNNKIPVADWPDAGFAFELYVADSKFNVSNDVAARFGSGYRFEGAYTESTDNSGAKNVEFVGKQVKLSGTTEEPFELVLTFPAAGSYYYVLKEVEGDVPSLRYDTKEYYLTFIVTDYTGNGILSVSQSLTYNGRSEELASFKNQLVAQEVDVQVAVTKALDNEAGVEIPMESFQFGLYTDAACTTPALDAAGNALVTTASTSGDASFNFHFDNSILPDGNAVRYTYYVKEIIPEDGAKVAGVTYDQSVYKVVITVEYNSEHKFIGYDIITQIVDADGTAIPEAEQMAESDNEMTFRNTFDPEDAKLAISGTKELTGRPIKNDEFEFALYEATVTTDADGALAGWTIGNQVGTNVSNSGESFAFPELTFSAAGTQYYAVKEVVTTPDRNITYDSNEYLVEVQVTDDGNGALVADWEVVGKRYDSNTDAAAVAWVYTWATAAAPLELNVQNEFTPDPTVVEIEGTKTLIGDRKDAAGAAYGLQAGEFTFELYETDSSFVIPEGATPVKTVQNAADGSFAFVAEQDQSGNYITSDRLYFTGVDTRYFVLVEAAGEDPTITYNATEHNIKVTVTKNAVTGALEDDVEEVKTKLKTVAIENIYTAKEATATVPIKKNLVNETGVAYSVTNFSFGVYTDAACETEYVGSDVVVSGTDSHGNATVTFSYTDHDYSTAAGATNTYTYYIKEKTSADQRITYDGSVYKVEVELGYDSAKKLIAATTITKVLEQDGTTEVAKAATTAAFTNTFSLGTASVEIAGSKVVSGGDSWPTNAEFTIELYKTGELGNYAEDGVLIGKDLVKEADKEFEFTAEGTDVSSGDAIVPELEFTKAGTYYFVVREYRGGLTDTTEKLIYDGTQYVVVVNVAPDDAANPTKLVVESTSTYVFGHEHEAVSNISFTNINYEGKTTVDIIGKKDLTDRNIIDQEFDFELYKATVTTQGGVEKWTTEGTPYLTTVNREKATDQKYEGYNVEFIGVPLESKNTTEPETHYFVLKELDTQNPTITYSTVEYRITVVAELDAGGDYNINSVAVYKVEDGKAEEIKNAYQSSTGQVICIAEGKTYSFTNDYTPKTTEETGDAVIRIDKELTNNTGVTTVTEAGFRFGLYADANCQIPVKAKADADSAGKLFYIPASDGGVNVEATSEENGDASIRLRFTDAMYDAAKEDGHVYTYYLKEIAGDKAGMTYDDTVYEVKVALSYDANKQLKATTTVSEVATAFIGSQAEVSAALFQNTYELDPAKVVLEGRKELAGHDALKSNFSFSLYKAVVDGENNWTIDGQDAFITATNEEKVDSTVAGNDYDKFVFAEIPYDTAGTYYYIMKEDAGKLGGVTYDESEYHITVEVVPDDADNMDDDGDNAMNDLVAKVSMEKVEKDSSGQFRNPVPATIIVFNNSYLAKGTFSIGGTKELTGRQWRDSDEFTFALYKTDASHTVISGDAPVATDTVKGTDAVKAFSFEDVEVSGVSGGDTHYFVIKEFANGGDCMDYDTTEYKIVVNATDLLNGTLEIDQAQLDSYEIKFENKYQTNEVAASISGEKVLTAAYTDREIKDGEFEFALYEAAAVTDESGKIVDWLTGQQVGDAVTNTGNTFTIDDIKFTREGEYYFVVKEVAGNNAIITYDTTEHRVKVKVSDIGDTDNDNKANLKAEVFYIDADGNVAVLADQITFHNLYNDTQVVIAIEKTITHTGDITHTLGGFQFQVKNVTTDTVYKDKAVTDNTGHTSFAISYDENDIGKTYVYEITEVNTGIKDMIYDTYVHKLEVTLEAENGQLVAKVVLNNVPVNDVKVGFANTYQGQIPKPDDPEEPGDPVITDNVPKTGDETNLALYMGLMAVSAIMIAVILVMMRKKQKEQELKE